MMFRELLIFKKSIRRNMLKKVVGLVGFKPGTFRFHDVDATAAPAGGPVILINQLDQLISPTDYFLLF